MKREESVCWQHSVSKKIRRPELPKESSTNRTSITDGAVCFLSGAEAEEICFIEECPFW